MQYIGEKPFYCDRCPYVKPGTRPITPESIGVTIRQSIANNQNYNNSPDAISLGKNGDNNTAKMIRRIHVFNEMCRYEAARYQYQLWQYHSTCHIHNQYCYPCWYLY